MTQVADITIDARPMEPPEPFVATMDALYSLDSLISTPDAPVGSSANVGTVSSAATGPAPSSRSSSARSRSTSPPSPRRCSTRCAGWATATECAAWGVVGSFAIAWWSGGLNRESFTAIAHYIADARFRVVDVSPFVRICKQPGGCIFQYLQTQFTG